MVRKSLIAAALLVLCSISFSDEPEQKPEYYNAVVRIDGCSGVIVRTGPEVSVGVSAQHCTGKVGEVVRFRNPDGSGGYARWVAEDVRTDLSLFRVWTRDTKRVSVSVQANGDRPSKEFSGWGYPQGKGPHWKRLKFDGKFNITGLESPRNQFEVKDGVFNNGDSGGGVFNNGKLFGITSHGSKNHKHLFACTKEQLNEFLKRVDGKLKSKLVKWEAGKMPPLGSDDDREVALSEVIKAMMKLQAENKLLAEKVRKIANTPIRVQVLDPVSGKVLAEESYPFGTPIKLVLPERR